MQYGFLTIGLKEEGERDGDVVSGRASMTRKLWKYSSKLQTIHDYWHNIPLLVKSFNIQNFHCGLNIKEEIFCGIGWEYQ